MLILFLVAWEGLERGWWARLLHPLLGASAERWPLKPIFISSPTLVAAAACVASSSARVPVSTAGPPIGDRGRRRAGCPPSGSGPSSSSPVSVWPIRRAYSGSRSLRMVSSGAAMKIDE